MGRLLRRSNVARSAAGEMVQVGEPLRQVLGTLLPFLALNARAGGGYYGVAWTASALFVNTTELPNGDVTCGTY